MYDTMFDTIASGFIADELPQDLAEKFLALIQVSNVYGFIEESPNYKATFVS